MFYTYNRLSLDFLKNIQLWKMTQFFSHNFFGFVEGIIGEGERPVPPVPPPYATGQIVFPSLGKSVLEARFYTKFSPFIA